MYICIYVYVDVHVPVYVYVYAYAYGYVNVNVYVYVYVSQTGSTRLYSCLPTSSNIIDFFGYPPGSGHLSRLTTIRYRCPKAGNRSPKEV